MAFAAYIKLYTYIKKYIHIYVTVCVSSIAVGGGVSQLAKDGNVSFKCLGVSFVLLSAELSNLLLLNLLSCHLFQE